MPETETNIYVIPDVHGDPDALRQSGHALGCFDGNGLWCAGTDTLVLAGDYVDRGKKGVEVLDFITDLRKKILEAGGQVICLMGNHEPVLLEIAFGRFNEGFLVGSLLDEIEGFDLEAKKAVLRAKIVNDWSWLLEAPLCTQIRATLVVHGGLSVDWAETLQKQGIQPLNTECQAALREAIVGGNWENFDRFYSVKYSNVLTPNWFKFSDYESIGQFDRAATANALFSLGIKQLLVAHDQQPKGPFRFDLKGKGDAVVTVMNSDTAMSSAWHFNKGKSRFGGLVIRPDGKVEGLKKDGALIELFPNCAVGHDKTVKEDD